MAEMVLYKTPPGWNLGLAMRWFIYSSLVVFALAATISKEDLDFNRKLVKETIEILGKEEIIASEKKQRIAYALDNFKGGDYKAKYEKLLADVKEGAEKLPKDSAREAAKKMIELWENGDILAVSKLREEISSEDREIIDGGMLSFYKRIESDFGELDPNLLE